MKSDMLRPKVSVFMPVYNAENYLNESIDSILTQSFEDFEFVIVNDGSTDRSADVIKSYSDKRIRFIENPKNLGLIASLNIGLDICKGDYIVRMDQDDFSLPQRIEKQVLFMDENPEYGLIGCWFEDFGENIESKVIRYSGDDTYIRIRHLYQTHIAHPTAVLRKAVIDEHNLRFDPEYVHGEDYAFWVHMSAFCKLSNYPEMLVRKRDHPGNISNRYAQIQQNTCARVKQKQFEAMGVIISQEEIELYTRFANPDWTFSQDEMMLMHNLLEKMAIGNEGTNFIPKEPLKSYLAEKWFHLCLQNRSIYKTGLSWWNKLSFRNDYVSPLKSKIKMKVKALGILI
jgi:glycosyltransferase involved in cell wall biosynthesis